jgi:hypothetical protein
MRNLRELDKWRLTGKALPAFYGGYEGDETCGAFAVPIGSHLFAVVAAANKGFDHVSVSLPNRCPSWEEMDKMKRLFFKPDEIAFQVHPKETDHISVYPFCLHLWRCWWIDPPMPPKEFV